MKTSKILLSVLLALTVGNVPASATCGGGGGGGMGGMNDDQMVYDVPWQFRKDLDSKATLALYWVADKEQVAVSRLKVSRLLCLYGARGVATIVLDKDGAGQKFGANNVVLCSQDGEIGRVKLDPAANEAGQEADLLKVEKLLTAEMTRREQALQELLLQAASKAQAGDKKSAEAIYRSVLAQKVMFPRAAAAARKALLKMGLKAVEGVQLQVPVQTGAVADEVVRLMTAGLKAELSDHYLLAEKLYKDAHRLDPADPVPLRYLGELYRHDIGDWDKATQVFEQILAMGADPLSRAVALHGIGKMTIHNGEFKKGLGLIEQSISVYPLALAYRNLAVYWNSEGDPKRAYEYTQEAFKLDPKDPFNRVFSAVFMAGSGHCEEALKIAAENEGLMCASYNLAAIYAQSGKKEKALALLRRHFFEYERYQAVRSKEMMEARVDHVFDSLKQDKTFLSLTSGADGKLKMR